MGKGEVLPARPSRARRPPRIGCARRPSSRHRGLRRQRRNRFPRSRSVSVQKADGSHQTAEIQVEQNRQSVAWIKPTLIAEIAFRAWSSDLKLRHTSYKGLREVQDNSAVFKIV
ncbi:hypothetical protein [Rhizobium sp. RAF56]|uniref:ATP dependent DNA ligase n=1 Tax=Rhizobium sp. RAF56 TaxID=3233062 RepID=UPI003F96FD31